MRSNRKEALSKYVQRKQDQGISLDECMIRLVLEDEPRSISIRDQMSMHETKESKDANDGIGSYLRNVTSASKDKKG